MLRGEQWMIDIVFDASIADVLGRLHERPSG